MALLRMFSVLGVLASPLAIGDSLKSNDGAAHEGRLEFHEGAEVQLVKTNGERVAVSLGELSSARIEPDPPAKDQWVLGGTGALTVNGSFLASRVVAMDATKVSFEKETEGIVLTTQNTAAVFFHPPSVLDMKHIKLDRVGILLRSGDFMEGEFHAFANGVVSIGSLLLGRKTFTVQDDVTAVFLRKVREGNSVFAVKAGDGSWLRSKELRIVNGGISLDGSPYRDHRIPGEQLVEIRKGDLPSIASLIDARWRDLNAGKSEEVIAMESDPQMVSLTRKRESTLQEQKRLTVLMNKSRQDWQRWQQVWNQKNNNANRAKSDSSRMRSQAKSKERLVKSAQRNVAQGRRDLDEKTRRLNTAKQAIDRAREDVKKAGADDDARRRAETNVRNKDRERQNAERAVNQSKSNHARQVDRVKRAERDHQTAREQAKKVEEKEPIARQEAEEALRMRDEAKRALDRATADLRTTSTEFRRVEETLRKRREILQAVLSQK